MTWSDEVVWRRRHPVGVGDEWRAEVIHLVVEEDPSGGGHEL